MRSFRLLIESNSFTSAFGSDCDRTSYESRCVAPLPLKMTSSSLELEGQGDGLRIFMSVRTLVLLDGEPFTVSWRVSKSIPQSLKPLPRVKAAVWCSSAKWASSFSEKTWSGAGGQVSVAVAFADVLHGLLLEPTFSL